MLSATSFTICQPVTIRFSFKAEPQAAKDIADEIDANLEAASNVSGFHPDSCHRLAVWLRDWTKAL